MEFYNRRLLLLNEDVPSSTLTPISPLPPLQHTEPTTTNSSSPPGPTISSSSSSSLQSVFERPLKLPTRPVFTSNVAYAFVILFTALFFLGFVLLYIHQFAGDSHAAASSRRRRRRHRHRHDRQHSCEGVDASTVKSLPVFSYHHGGVKEQEQEDCAICLSEFEEGERVKMTPYCKHVFHPECIDTWLLSHVTCPICRCTKFSEVEEEQGGGSRSTRVSTSMNEHDHEMGSTAENGGEGGEVGS